MIIYYMNSHPSSAFPSPLLCSSRLCPNTQSGRPKFLEVLAGEIDWKEFRRTVFGEEAMNYQLINDFEKLQLEDPVRKYKPKLNKRHHLRKLKLRKHINKRY